MPDNPATEVIAPDIEAGELVCELCGVPLMPASAHSVGGHTACERCLDQLEAEVAEQQAGAASIPLAVVGTLVGALIGAAVWAGVAISTNFAIGYIAILVGYLAGKGTMLATGGRHGRTLQVVAVGGALFGLLAANYAIFAHGMKTLAFEDQGVVIGYLDPFITSNFGEYMLGRTGLFDLLWVFLAVSSAWRAPAAPRLHVQRS